MEIAIKAKLRLPKNTWNTIPSIAKKMQCYLHPDKNNSKMLLSLYGIKSQGKIVELDDEEILTVSFLSAFDNPAKELEKYYPYIFTYKNITGTIEVTDFYPYIEDKN